MPGEKSVEDRLSAIEHWRTGIASGFFVCIAIFGMDWIDDWISDEPKVREARREAISEIEATKNVAIQSISGVPTGSMLPFYGTTNQVPKGFLLCDGRKLPKKGFSALADHLALANTNLWN